MTSGDTNAKTLELLEANAYFGPLWLHRWRLPWKRGGHMFHSSNAVPHWIRMIIVNEHSYAGVDTGTIAIGQKWSEPTMVQSPLLNGDYRQITSKNSWLTEIVWVHDLLVSRIYFSLHFPLTYACLTYACCFQMFIPSGFMLENMLSLCMNIQILVGGLEHFLFSHILGMVIPID